MKKIVLLVIIVVSLLITGCSENNINNSDEEAKLLLVAYNYSFKYAATYDGVGIYDDGTVRFLYLSTSRREYNNYMGSYSVNTKSGIEKLYLEKGIKKDKTVSVQDLTKIKEYINNINSNNIDTTCVGDDKVYSMLYLFKRDEELRFYTSDCEKNTSNKDVTELLSTIAPYRKIR